VIHPHLNKLVLSTCTCFTLLHIAFDFFFFDLKTIKGHGYIFLLEVLLQACIYSISPRIGHPLTGGFQKKWLASIWIINGITLGYKLTFISLLSDARYVSDFFEVFPFATGPAYNIRQIADGYIDLIANALYQCNLCLQSDKIPLNEPFIAYLFVFISTLAGEFNHHILWLTLHCANVLAALVLLKTAQDFFPKIRFLWAIPLLYLTLFEVHGVTLLLFKDGLIVLLTLLLLYINYGKIFKDRWGRFAFVALSVVLIVFLYNLRTGILAAILCMSLLNVAFDLKNWKIHVTAVILGVASIAIIGNVDGFSNKLQKSLTRTTDKVIHGTEKHLDTDSLTYTTTRENSLFHKFKLHEVTPTNFFYAPAVKASLYFLLPLPVNKVASLPDLFHKLSTLIYSALFTTFLFGLYKMLSERRREDWYLVGIFGIFVALFLGAGPMLVPRYRIMTSALFLLIAMVGASGMSNRMIAWNVGASAIGVAALVLWYDELYNLIQSLT
jgi:hypothetical protein